MKISFGFDVGTTGIKSVLITEEGTLLASEMREQQQFFPHSGWVEQDPQELLDYCLDSFRTLIKKCSIEAKNISCIGLDHQGESCLVWEQKTGNPVYPVITWQDRRMAQGSEEYGKEYGDKIQSLTGLRSDSYYSAWKIRWILDNIKDGQSRAENGELMAGTLNTWLFWNFTGQKSFITDEGSANVMMLCDPRVTGWNEWLLKQMQIPIQILPKILPCNAVHGITDRSFFGAEIPITCSLTDCAASVVSSGAVARGDLTVTYGTGSFMHLITGSTYIIPSEGLTAACSFATKKKHVFKLNGICYSAGSAVTWLKNGLGIITCASETEDLAKSVTDTGGVHFIPAFNGLATPFWDQTARGAFLGMTASSNKAHLVRAVLESSALQVANCSHIMERVSGIRPNFLHAMGGMTTNSFLMQLQADLCGIPVRLPLHTEPAYGSACMAFTGIGAGLSIEELKDVNSAVHTYYPNMRESERKEKIDKWCYAAERITNWEQE